MYAELRKKNSDFSRVLWFSRDDENDKGSSVLVEFLLYVTSYFSRVIINVLDLEIFVLDWLWAVSCYIA